MSGVPKAERERRDAMRHHEQMLDAEKLCVPCKLCGGAAKISDAGTGAGYYIACSNSTTWRDSTGCLINERRLGGWAYNVMDWWNRLHATTPSQGLDAATVERCASIADEVWGDGPSGSYDNGATADGWNMASVEIAKQIRALATEPHQHGGKGA